MMNLNYGAFKSISKMMEIVDVENDCATLYKKGNIELFIAVCYNSSYTIFEIVVNGLKSVHTLKSYEEVRKAKKHIAYLISLVA